MIVQSANHQSWKIDAGSRFIDMPVSPVLFATSNEVADHALNLDDFHDFDAIPVEHGAQLVYEKNTGQPTRAFQQALLCGGLLLVPKSPLSWFHMMTHSPENAALKALRQFNATKQVTQWTLSNWRLDLSKPHIMGIWNVSPDSFSSSLEPCDPTCNEHARTLCQTGANILDIGAESTRPGADAVSESDEIRRLHPALSWANANLNTPVSLDSRHPGVIQWAIQSNLIHAVNDTALTGVISHRREGVFYPDIKNARCGLILMAWNPHNAPSRSFAQCLNDILSQLALRLEFAFKSGLCMDQILLDPGIGFGKGLENDIRLISQSSQALSTFSRPVLIAHSRKRCLQNILQSNLYSDSRARHNPHAMHKLSLEDIDWVSALAALKALRSGAHIVRVHNPRITALALRLSAALE